MKNKKAYLGIIALMLIVLNLKSQEDFTKYYNRYAKRIYDIQVNFEGIDKFTLYIDAMSLDELFEKGGFMVDNKKYQGFIDALNEAKIKYQEWDQTAKANNVKDVKKEMPIKSKVSGYFLYGRDWHFQFLVNLKFDFVIMERDGEVKNMLMVKTGEMTSSSNQFMDVDGVILVFSSVEEINDFVDSISLEKINEFKNKPKSEDLFK